MRAAAALPPLLLVGSSQLFPDPSLGASHRTCNRGHGDARPPPCSVTTFVFARRRVRSRAGGTAAASVEESSGAARAAADNRGACMEWNEIPKFVRASKIGLALISRMK